MAFQQSRKFRADNCSALEVGAFSGDRLAVAPGVFVEDPLKPRRAVL
jgi:hypothetical protein